MTKLYEISQQYNDILEQLADEHITVEQINDYLSPIEEAFKEKAVNIVKIIKNKEAVTESISNEIARLSRRKQNAKCVIDRLKAYLKNNIEATGGKPIVDDLFNISITDNPYKVQITEGEKVPNKFLRIKKEPDLTSIKEYLKENGDKKWATLIKGNSLRIR